MLKDKVGDFKKYDQGKPRPDLFPSVFLLEIGRVMAYGAAKYGEENWHRCEQPRRYLSAAWRHLVSYTAGERLDPESGLHHLAHCAASLGMYFHLKETIKP